jgi:hypothetical protein
MIYIIAVLLIIFIAYALTVRNAKELSDKEYEAYEKKIREFKNNKT